MDTDSFVIGLVVAAILAVFWHRDVMKSARMSYAEMRAKWLVAEFDAEVIRSEGDWFVASIENNKKIILFFDDESLVTKIYAEKGFHAHARKWKNIMDYLNDEPIWNEKHFPTRFENRK